ncbi:MAG TPA: imelysin family protein [Rhizobiaceae bacterium]|nr:imelysin family protein [Rhizobiaceae bacterium]
MRRRAFLTLAAAGLVSTRLAQAQSRRVSVSDVLHSAVRAFIQPGYERLRQDAELMAAAADRLCATPSQAAFEQAQARFRSLVVAWSRIEIVRFGPVLEDNRADRMFFFPDRRGIGLRQIQTVLSEKDKTAASAESLATKSVALQGLGALEYLLFGTGAESLATGDGFRCRFAAAVCRRIEATATELAEEWDKPDGIAMRFAEPAPRHADFRNEEESLRALLGVLINGAEMIDDVRLRPFMGPDAAGAKPKLAPWWRSGMTGESIAAAFDGMEQIVDVTEIALLLPPDRALAVRSVMFEFANARRAIRKLSMPMPQAATDFHERQTLQYLLIVTKSLRRLFTNDLAGGLGLSAGFSPLDGD